MLVTLQGNGIQGLDSIAQLTNPFRAFLRSKFINQQNVLYGSWSLFWDFKWRFHYFFFFLIIQVLRLQHENEVAKFNSFVVMQEVELGRQNTPKLLDMERIYCLWGITVVLIWHWCIQLFLGHCNLFKKIKCQPLGFYTFYTEDKLLLAFQMQLWRLLQEISSRWHRNFSLVSGETELA